MGAWIETCEGLQTKLKLVVAPYVGAWIETYVNEEWSKNVKSHPMWVRGLKLK